LRCDACWPAPCRCPKDPAMVVGVPFAEVARYLLTEWPDARLDADALTVTHEWPAVTSSLTQQPNGQLLLEATRRDAQWNPERQLLPCAVREAVQAWRTLEARHRAWDFGLPPSHPDEDVQEEAREEFADTVAMWVMDRRRVERHGMQVPELPVAKCPVCWGRAVVEVRADPDVGCELCWECEGCTLQWDVDGRPV
jgi:hypothetical protein